MGKGGERGTHERDIEGGREAEEEGKSARGRSQGEMRRDEQEGMAAMQGSRMTRHGFCIFHSQTPKRHTRERDERMDCLKRNGRDASQPRWLGCIWRK